ncbi:SH3 domain-containing protein [Lunatimonas salinarum]|uniref:SH3 domain-containing protein n=1 Tax=Lunatimonas salinarum TaxID=1774590 RepID=UPI001ADFB48B|nr:SH3 domain-containing protein [Lunatimonas salinarum]
MPNIHRVIVAKFSVFFLGLFYVTVTQASDISLSKADSLFAEKQYTDALVIYERMLRDEGSYSPAMLLKMAFISEGMGDFAKSTTYLSKYYDHNPNPKVITKIRSLTGQTTLYGYEVSDGEKFLKFLLDVKMELSAFLTFFVLVLIIFAVAYPRKRKVFYAPALVCLTLALACNNLLNAPETAIVTGSPTLIMDSPTAAGNLIRRVEVGHRVKIESSVDKWYEVEWNNRKAYIRKDNLSKI